MTTVESPADTPLWAPPAVPGAGGDLGDVVAPAVHEPPVDPRWVRPAVIALLATTGLLYLWGLGASGWANEFYSAAVQAGTKSWKAFFFGSSDSANFITVDKPPASLWVMELSARVFGLSSWSILVPQAVEGVAAAGLLYLTVKRWFGAAAGLIAGAVMALTPVAVLMFRFNNPDSLLVLLMVAAAYMVTRAIEDGATKWLVWAGVLLGFGFLTKMLQVLTVLPAFTLAYLLAGPPRLGRRIWQLLLGGLAMVVAAGWWVAAVELWPEGSRPFVGGSTDNSVLDLVFGYNGFGRLTGNETGSVVAGGAQGQSGMWGPTGWTRLFNESWGAQASWLIPAALLFAVVGLVLAGVRDRRDRIRSAVVIWGGWLFVTGAVFSLGEGIIHEYYSVALAPAVGALVGIGATVLWALREQWWARGALASAVALTAWWSTVLLHRVPGWNEWLPVVVLAAAGVAVTGLLLGHDAARWGIGAAAVVALAGPAAYSVATVSNAHRGAIPVAGPSTPGFGAARGPGGGPRPMPPGGAQDGTPGGGAPAVPGGGAPPAVPGGGAPPAFPGQTGQRGTLPGGPGGAGGVGGVGGLLFGSDPSDAVVQFLEDGADGSTWTLATIGANRAAGFQLATDDPVMAIGGFNGTDDWPTLEQFQQLVEDHRVHYFLAGGIGGPGGGRGTSSTISDWVTTTFTAVTVDGTTFYDLGRPLN